MVTNQLIKQLHPISYYAVLTYMTVCGLFAEAQQFVQPPLIPVGNRPSAVAIGDFNRDGKQDLIEANDVDRTVSVLLGNGDGTFSAQPAVSLGTVPLSNQTALGSGRY